MSIPFNNGYQNFQTQYPSQQKQNVDWIMVPDVEHVEQVQVQPGQKAWIMVQNDTIFALRVADNMGLATTDYYKFEKYSPIKAREASSYVTQEQMQTYMKQIKEDVYESVMRYFNEPTTNATTK